MALLAVVPVLALAAGASVIVPHGLTSDGQPIAPTLVQPDSDTPIACTAVDATACTFTNNGLVAASATFLVERIHSIQAQPSFPPFLWAGPGAGGGGGVVGVSNVAKLDAIKGDDATAAVGNGIPFRTMQAAVNACKAAHDALGPPDSPARFRSGYVIDPAPFTSYDEDVVIDVTNGFHLQITGQSGWMLGVFDDVNWTPNPASNRSITITGDSRALAPAIDIRPSVIIGSLDATPYFGTNHLAWYGPRIAGQIKIDLVTGGQPLSGHCELGLNCELFGNTFASVVDMTGKNPIITLQIINSRFRKPANFGTASNIFGCWRSRFSGLLTCNTWATFQDVRFDAGFTTTGNVANFPPAGLFNCGCAGTFTGPAGPNLRIDLASNTTLVDGGNVVVGWTKKILNDATP
jgi:hypothetical protein